MPYSGLADFISTLEKNGELHRIRSFVNPLLEITEITDRITKSGGKALLFENTGTDFPLLINAFGSQRRIRLALGNIDPGKTGAEFEKLFSLISDPASTLTGKIALLPDLFKASSFFPAHSKKKAPCQQIVHREPDLSILPVLKCWPHDGGRFITLPMVHTCHPETGSTNIGMYRVQILGRETAAMHWQRHKTGASHFEAWRETGEKMPVTVTLGGDPVYTYAATAPLPEKVSEYLLAGFLRKKRVKLVKCITNDIYVPHDADIVIEGYVDPMEDLVEEGPFGDHTGFYSLADNYPRLHVTCITHSKNAVYPATIVGIPPQEDAWITEATEKIFLAPLKLALQPEIEDFHMPEAGVAHNLLIVKIRKTFPGQGIKIINSLCGTGQMMFTKYLAVVSGEVNIRNYHELALHILDNTDPVSDILFLKGPLDVLDHSSDSFSFGGKAGIDATAKLPEERSLKTPTGNNYPVVSETLISEMLAAPFIKSYNFSLLRSGIKVLVLSINPSEDPEALKKVASLLERSSLPFVFRLAAVVDHTVDVNDLFMVAWQLLGNSDPMRDHIIISGSLIMIDGTIKYYREGGFGRPWPNVVCSLPETIRKIDENWNSFGFDEFIPSPSLKFMPLVRKGTDRISE